MNSGNTFFDLFRMAIIFVEPLKFFGRGLLASVETHLVVFTWQKF